MLAANAIDGFGSVRAYKRENRVLEYIVCVCVSFVSRVGYVVV